MHVSNFLNNLKLKWSCTKFSEFQTAYDLNKGWEAKQGEISRNIFFCPSEVGRANWTNSPKYITGVLLFGSCVSVSESSECLEDIKIFPKKKFITLIGRLFNSRVLENWITKIFFSCFNLLPCGIEQIVCTFLIVVSHEPIHIFILPSIKNSWQKPSKLKDALKNLLEQNIRLPYFFVSIRATIWKKK